MGLGRYGVSEDVLKGGFSDFARKIVRKRAI